MMKIRACLCVVTLCLLMLVGCGTSYEYDGFYNDGDYISSDIDVKFCTMVNQKGDKKISGWTIMKQAGHNPAIETDLSAIKSIAMSELSEFVLKYSLTRLSGLSSTLQRTVLFDNVAC